ncbi:MAG: hypothetical protein LBC46_04235, partial [Treponema sp.]|nr:hypothetical protein [Treponema sp.]
MGSLFFTDGKFRGRRPGIHSVKDVQGLIAMNRHLALPRNRRLHQFPLLTHCASVLGKRNPHLIGGRAGWLGK